MYITVDELGVPEDMLIRLTDDEGTGMANTSRAEDAIAAAQARVDAALYRRFDTPLGSPSGLVRAIVRDLAVYGLYLRLGNVPGPVRLAYEDASGMLEKASRGDTDLGLEGSSSGPEFSYADREFTRERMEGF